MLSALDGVPGEVYLRIAEEMLSKDTTTKEPRGVLSEWNQSCQSWRALLRFLSYMAQFNVGEHTL